MEQYLKKGLVLKLNKDEDKQYIVLESLVKDNKEYALLTDIEGEIDIENSRMNNIRVDYSKTFMVSYDREQKGLTFETNDEILQEMLKNVLNK